MGSFRKEYFIILLAKRLQPKAQVGNKITKGSKLNQPKLLSYIKSTNQRKLENESSSITRDLNYKIGDLARTPSTGQTSEHDNALRMTPEKDKKEGKRQRQVKRTLDEMTLR